MATRRALGALLALIALNAIGGGIYGVLGADAVPAEWLSGSPFASYLIPSVILLVAVGGSQAFAAIMVLRAHRSARVAALIAGLVLLTWIVVQVALIGYVSFLQPTMAIASLLILAMAWRLR